MSKGFRNKLEDGQTAFSISADNATYPPSISAIQNGIIAYVLNQMKWSVNGENISLQAVGEAKEFTLTVKKKWFDYGGKTTFIHTES